MIENSCTQRYPYCQRGGTLCMESANNIPICKGHIHVNNANNVWGYLVRKVNTRFEG